MAVPHVLHLYALAVVVDLVHPQIACGRPDGKAAFRCTRHQKTKYRVTRITPGNPAQEFPYQHNEPTEHRTLPAVTQWPPK